MTNKIRVRFIDGYDYRFKREEMMYSIPENISIRINDGVEAPSDGASDYGEKCAQPYPGILPLREKYMALYMGYIWDRVYHIPFPC